MGSPWVIGIDPSLTATGIASRLGSTWTFGGPATHGDRRLQVIRDGVLATCHAPHPDLAVIEGPYVHNLNNSMTLGMVHGVVRLACIDAGVPYAIVSPATLKKYATGNGGADKAAMRAALRRHTGIDEKDDNRVDAWWLRHMGLDHLGHPVIALPDAQRASLSRVPWPDLPTRGAP